MNEPSGVEGQPVASENRPLRRRRIKLDRKGRGLLLASACWALVGQKVLLGTEIPLDSTFHQGLPQWVRLVIWFGAAALAFGAAFSNRLRRIAVAALVVGPAMRVLSYLIAWVISIIPGPPPGVASGWYNASVFAIMLGFVFFIASDKPDSTAADLVHALTENTDTVPSKAGDG